MLWVLDHELFLSLYPFLNDACLSLSLFISSPAGLLLPAIFFFFLLSFPCQQTEFWLPPALLSDMISQNHFRVPTDRRQLLLLFLLQPLLSALLCITHFFPQPDSKSSPAQQAFSQENPRVSVADPAEGTGPKGQTLLGLREQL